MSQRILVYKKDMENIGDAIRRKTGGKEKIKISKLDDEIDKISGGESGMTAIGSFSPWDGSIFAFDSEQDRVEAIAIFKSYGSSDSEYNPK